MSDDEVTQPSVMPEQPKTKPIPAADPVAVALIQLKQSVDAIGGNVTTLMEDGKGVNLRLTNIETRLGAVEARPTPLTSERVRAVVDEQPSKADLETQAQLAQERAAREAIAAKVDTLLDSQTLQTDILKRVDRFFDLCDRVRQHRLTKLILAIATLLLGGYAASKGLK